jgi:hypothetical protein
MGSGHRADHDQGDQQRSEWREPASPPFEPQKRECGALAPGGFAWQIGDELLELSERLCLIATLEPLLELGGVQATLGVASTETLSRRFAIRVGRAQVGIASEEGVNPGILVGHDMLLSCGLCDSRILTFKRRFVVG